jgi:hypothetical protein
MQGIQYKYKLTRGHTSDKAVYEPCISKDKEVNSIEDIQALQDKQSTKAIPKLS